MEPSNYSTELYPIRCFSCGKVLAGIEEIRKAENIEQAMTVAGYKRICCRSVILTSVPIVTGYGIKRPEELQKIQYLMKDKKAQEEYKEEDKRMISIPSLELEPDQLVGDLSNLTLGELQKQKINANEEEAILLVKGEFEKTNYGYIEPIAKREYYAI